MMTNRLPEPTNGESEGSESSAHEQDVNPEHMLTIDKLTDVLTMARDMDQALNPDATYPLSRRFVIEAQGGNPHYPFAHDRVALRPRHGVSRPMNLEGMVLRYGIGIDVENFGLSYNGVILVTIGVGRGQSTECLLSGSEWATVGNAGVRVEEGELLGLQGSTEEPPFDVATLRNVLQYFEPELQDNATPPRA